MSAFRLHCGGAARKAERAASLNDAVAYAEKRVACLESLPRTKDVEKRIIDATPPWSASSQKAR